MNFLASLTNVYLNSLNLSVATNQGTPAKSQELTPKTASILPLCIRTHTRSDTSKAS